MPERDLSESGQPIRASPASVSASMQTAQDLCVMVLNAPDEGARLYAQFLTAMSAESKIAVFVLARRADELSTIVAALGQACSMNVQAVAEGTRIATGHCYVAAPGSYPVFAAGVMHLAPAATPGNGGLGPVDDLLVAVARLAGPRAVYARLSGSGAAGLAGAKAILSAGGLVLLPPGGPSNAAGLVLPVRDMPRYVLEHFDTLDTGLTAALTARIVAVLKARTAHDFTQYKPGTVARRIMRRMAMAGLSPGRGEEYLKLLEADHAACDSLAEDIWINVTSFFRDPKVFELLAAKVIPQMVQNATGGTIRMWIAGCSTGEEAYSLAMVFQDEIRAARAELKLQIFASDIDADAILTAREGRYARAIAADISPARLHRYFTETDGGYRVVMALRSSIVFAVQDILTDPPFSRMDLVSCRNLMIYLQPAAQRQVIGTFNFALRQNGVLLLGAAEAASVEGVFETVSKSARIYRKIGGGKSETVLSVAGSEPGRGVARAPLLRQALTVAGGDMAEMTRRLLLEHYTPAAVLINRRMECLFSTGESERYLRVPPGYPTHDVLALIQPVLRLRLRAAIAEALETNARISVTGGRIIREGKSIPYMIDILPVAGAGETLIFLCFIDQPLTVEAPPAAAAAMVGQDAELTRELAATRADLQAALRNIEILNEEHHAINEEAMSVSEEYQSTNEELLTSKEELQSLNEELTALNSQLQETLERSRNTANDLQNVLYSTNVATIFLDLSLNIRFFTPAAQALFGVIPGDIGRPLADLRARVSDPGMLADARRVLADSSIAECEIQTDEGAWLSRRILPYRTPDGETAGVVMTFQDITERKASRHALEAAQKASDYANLAKSRFLAAASHDLRQPLQTLALVGGMLARMVQGEEAIKLVARLDQTTNAMAGMLNALLDINQIDAGVVQTNMIDFPVNDLLRRMGEAFSYAADAQGISLKLMPCGLNVHSDPALLEQILRNLISNALKYTRTGRVLVGCRRRAGRISLQIWDTGIGMPKHELREIFEEYHQINNVARARARGLGLGLSIVQRLAQLLGHPVTVDSVLGRGSVFSIEIPRGAAAEPVQKLKAAPVPMPTRAGRILVIEDDPDIRQLLKLFLTEEGHDVTVAEDGALALILLNAGITRPELVIADYNLPSQNDGLAVVMEIRKAMGTMVPAIIVTGDISIATLRHVAEMKCLQMNKPMQLGELTAAIAKLLPPMPAGTAAPGALQRVYVVDDDAAICGAMTELFAAQGWQVSAYASGEAFLAAKPPLDHACLLLDAALPGISGFEVLDRLAANSMQLPVIMITGKGDIKSAVRAMRAGVLDFIEKPARQEVLLASITRAFGRANEAEDATRASAAMTQLLAGLTTRQTEVLTRVLDGQPSKTIAQELGISQRTVENHRAAIMTKTGTKSIPALVRLVIAARRDS